MLRPDQLHTAGTFFTHVREQLKGMTRGNVEALTPAFEHPIVVGQQSPQKRLHRFVSVLQRGERHRERKRIASLIFSPLGFIMKGQPIAAAVPQNATHQSCGSHRLKFLSHDFDSSELRMMRSRSIVPTAFGPELPDERGDASIFIPSSLRSRKTSPTWAVAFPFPAARSRGG